MFIGIILGIAGLGLALLVGRTFGVTAAALTWLGYVLVLLALSRFVEGGEMRRAFLISSGTCAFLGISGLVSAFALDFLLSPCGPPTGGS